MGATIKAIAKRNRSTEAVDTKIDKLLDFIGGGKWFEYAELIGSAGIRVCPGGFVVVERHQNVIYRIKWLVSVASSEYKSPFYGDPRGRASLAGPSRAGRAG